MMPAEARKWIQEVSYYSLHSSPNIWTMIYWYCLVISSCDFMIQSDGAVILNRGRTGFS